MTTPQALHIIRTQHGNKEVIARKDCVLERLCPPYFGLTIINRRNRLSPQLTVREIHLKFNLHRSYRQGLPKHTLTV